MRTTSGARVFRIGGRAVKVGTGKVGQRVETQAHYSRRLGSAAMPRITRIFRHGCVMERLSTYTREDAYIYDVTRILEQHVWCNAADEAQPNWFSHLEYVMDRANAYAPKYAQRIANLFYDMRLGASTGLRACLTHGDPTYDNMMMRGDQPILIDPLPPYPNGEMPQLAAVDVGKIMQSLIGYEVMKYGTSPFADQYIDGLFTELRDCLPPTSALDWQAAHWFLVTHIVRLIPYQPFENRYLCEQLLQIALNVAEHA